MPLGCTCDCETVAIGIPGPAGPPGAPGSGAGVYNETPGGPKNGINLVFTLANIAASGTTAVYRNGLREDLGVGYTESGATINFTTAPLISDELIVDYVIGS